MTMENLYAKFTDKIGHDLKNGFKRGELKKSLSERNFSFSGRENGRSIGGMPVDETLYKSLEPLASLHPAKAQYDQKPGAHPDFAYLHQTEGEENHYITSLFIDISRSTGLFRRYQPPTVKNITSTIQNAALYTCWHFGGYIQRFHGDGLLVYFGGKNMTVAQSVRKALDAASFFTYFVKNDLKHLFLEQGVDDIYTRIGIDTGLGEDVLWYKAGIGDCSEVTTCSLHTSLAAHMQGNAPGNGMMVGDHVKDHAGLSPDLYAIRKRSDGSEDRYIFQIPEENFNYTQWVFNWEKHLKNHPGVRIDASGKLYLAAAAATIVPPAAKNMDYLRSQVQGYKPYYNG